MSFAQAVKKYSRRRKEDSDLDFSSIISIIL